MPTELRVGRWKFAISSATFTALAVAGKIAFGWAINPLYTGLGASAAIIEPALLVAAVRREKAPVPGSE